MNHITCPPASPACQLQILGLFSLSNCVTYFHITTLFIFNLLLVLLFWRTLTNASVNVTSSIFGDPLRIWKSIAFGRMISTSLAAEIIGILLLRRGLRNSASALVQWSHSISPGCFYVLVYGKINMRVVFYVFLQCFMFVEERKSLKSLLNGAGICNPPRVPHTASLGANKPLRVTDFRACAPPVQLKPRMRKSCPAFSLWHRGAWSGWHDREVGTS